MGKGSFIFKSQNPEIGFRILAQEKHSISSSIKGRERGLSRQLKELAVLCITSHSAQDTVQFQDFYHKLNQVLHLL